MLCWYKVMTHFCKNKKDGLLLTLGYRRKDTLNLNISHRIMYDEIPDKPIKGIIFSFFFWLNNGVAMVTFIPTDNSQNELFNGLLRYFLERDRAGFISLEHHTLYLLPPCEKTSEFHQIGHNELLGLIFDTKDSGSSNLYY